MRAIAQVAGCMFVAAFCTVFWTAVLTLAIGFPGLPFVIVLYAGLFVLLVHFLGIEWGQ